MGCRAPLRFRRRIAALASMAILFPVAALALDYPLQPEEVEEAYSLGRTTNREELADFLNQYEHDFKYPSDNPLAYVTSVEFQTPYEQIVLKSFHAGQYDKFKAAEDYQTAAGAVFVRVVVALKITYPGPAPAAESFQVSVSQGAPIDARKATSTVLCDPYALNAVLWGGGACTYNTREILLQFNSDQFGRGKATVHVLLPEGKSLETQFNLNRLK